MHGERRAAEAARVCEPPKAITGLEGFLKLIRPEKAKAGSLTRQVEDMAGLPMNADTTQPAVIATAQRTFRGRMELNMGVVKRIRAFRKNRCVGQA